MGKAEADKAVRQHGVLTLFKLDNERLLRVEHPAFADRAEAWAWVKKSKMASGDYLLARALESRHFEVVQEPRVVIEQIPIWGARG